MRNKNLLVQVTSIERLDDNQFVFNKLQANILHGRGDEVVREMVGYPKSDLDPVGYDEIACNAYELNERIVFDNGQYVLTNRENQLIVLYEYPEEN
jgi:hypothetical protein